MASPKHKKEARRPPQDSLPYEPKDWQCVALLAVLVIVFFREILLGHAFLWEDFLYHDYPSRNFASVSLSMGEIPLWNPYSFNGMPFLADIQKTVFYLPCTVLALFVKDGQLSFYWLELMIILHYVLAGVTMFYLAVVLQSSPCPRPVCRGNLHALRIHDRTRHTSIHYYSGGMVPARASPVSKDAGRIVEMGLPRGSGPRTLHAGRVPPAHALSVLLPVRLLRLRDADDIQGFSIAVPPRAAYHCQSRGSDRALRLGRHDSAPPHARIRRPDVQGTDHLPEGNRGTIQLGTARHIHVSKILRDSGCRRVQLPWTRNILVLLGDLHVLRNPPPDALDHVLGITPTEQVCGLLLGFRHFCRSVRTGGPLCCAQVLLRLRSQVLDLQESCADWECS